MSQIKRMLEDLDEIVEESHGFTFSEQLYEHANDDQVAWVPGRYLVSVADEADGTEQSIQCSTHPLTYGELADLMSQAFSAGIKREQKAS